MKDLSQFKIEILQPISKTFCAAKWLMSDFYLHTGSTSSCHLPTPDKINFDQVKINIDKFNNTDEKIYQRELMLAGEQPSKCSNCWYIENSHNDAISERVIHSNHLFETYNDSFSNLEITPKPREITVAFDTLCNFVCSYCDGSQSSSWASDLKTNGLFKDILGDPKNTYYRLGSKELVDNYNEVFDKFCEYVITCTDRVKKITCLGGEPLMSPNFWKFIEFVSTNNIGNNLEKFTIVTNLSNEKLLNKYISFGNRLPISCAISIENVGKKSEFVRKGLNWETFENNLRIWLQYYPDDVTLLGTVSGVVLYGIIEYLDWVQSLNEEFNNRIKVKFFKVRHPNFQAIQVLPSSLKTKYKEDIKFWLSKNKVDEVLEQQLKSTIFLLDENCKEFEGSQVSLLQDTAKNFYRQFANRHNLSINDTFSSDLANWLSS